MNAQTMIARTVVLIEDKRFYRHRGIDPLAMLRALWVNTKRRRYAQGASTITQQLARTLYFGRDKTLTRKFREILGAFYLERKFSKQAILGIYMDWVYLGQHQNGTSVRGFRQASLKWFGKQLEETTIAQRANLVAMLKGPSYYNLCYLRGVERTEMVLQKMAVAGIISGSELAHALAELETTWYASLFSRP